MNKFVMLLAFTLFLNEAAFAYTQNYSDSNSSYNNGEYCAQDYDSDYGNTRKNVFTKIKNAFTGQMTGYTPQIPPSPYLNPYYGPSYNQGFYTGNQWNSHNVYNPAYPSARLFGMSF